MEISALSNLTQWCHYNPLEVGYQIIYLVVKITPYGGTLVIGTHSQNLIVDGRLGLTL